MIRQTVFLLLMVVLISGCKSTVSLQSRSLDRDINIDGSEADWRDALTPVQKEKITVGFLNDEDYLYLTLLSTDEGVLQQVMLQGMTVWFDPAGEKEKAVGVRFPLGLLEAGGGFGPGARRGQGEPPLEGWRPGEDVGLLRRAFSDEMLQELDLLREDGNEQMRMPREAVPGLSAYASIQNGTFIYEMKIPIRANGEQVFAVGASPGQEIGIGFETPEIERPQMGTPGGRPRGGGGMPGGAPPGGAPPGGGMGMPGAGMPPGGGGRPGGGAPGQQDPLKAWVKVTLAEV